MGRRQGVRRVQVSRTTWGCQKERGTRATHTHSVEQSCPAGSRFALAGGIPVQQKSHPRRPWQLIISWGYACLPRDSVGFQQNQPHDRLSGVAVRRSNNRSQPIPTGWETKTTTAKAGDVASARPLACRDRKEEDPQPSVRFAFVRRKGAGVRCSKASMF
jgi:hypothetical protein